MHMVTCQCNMAVHSASNKTPFELFLARKDFNTPADFSEFEILKIKAEAKELSVDESLLNDIKEEKIRKDSVIDNGVYRPDVNIVKLKLSENAKKSTVGLKPFRAKKRSI